jgi:hypothetical protein
MVELLGDLGMFITPVVTRSFAMSERGILAAGFCLLYGEDGHHHQTSN